MWTWVLIVVVVAIALAPLSHFAPSKRQRAVAGMREYAALNGMYVEFRNLPGAATGERPGSVIYYGKRLHYQDADGIKRAAWVRSGEGWRSVGARTPQPQALTSVPATVLAASVDPASCGVYWREEVAEGEGEQAVERIRLALEHWSASLAG